MNESVRNEQIQELIRAAGVLDRSGCCPATDGNFSVRSQGVMIVTRAGIEKRALSEASFVEISLEATDAGEATSEWQLHRALYVARPGIACILHVHAPYLTTFASTRRIPPVSLLSESQLSVGEIALVPYCRPGTQSLSEQTVASSATAMVYLLANHGAVALGNSVRDALHRLERAEFLARVAWQAAALGGGLPLSATQWSAENEGGAEC